MQGRKTVFLLLLGWLMILGSAWAQEDKKGCKDHPLFTRMEGYRIVTCKDVEFDAETFIDPVSKQKVTVEGRKHYTEYMTFGPYSGKYSRLQVSRNYANAISKIGGTAYEKTPAEPSETSMKVVKEGKEFWAKLQYNFGANYLYLTIMEKGAMTQQVVADAKAMAGDLGTSGKTIIYGIYFDFNKAEVKPDSDAALQEIAKLLTQNPKLRIYVVGHTDNVGGFDYNMKLSQQRAEAVVKELVSKYKVEASRLKPLGVGPAAPLTSNDSEEGKAKNRRVELVKQ